MSANGSEAYVAKCSTAIRISANGKTSRVIGSAYRRNISVLPKANWHRPAAAAALFALLLMGSSTEAAETRARQIRVAAEDMTVDASKARKLFARIEELTPLNGERKRVYAEREATIKELQLRLDAANDRGRDHQRELAALAERAEAQIKRCADAVRGESYRRCARDKDQIAARQAELDRITDKISADRKATISMLSAKLEEHTALAELLGQSIDELEQAQIEYSQLFQRVQAVRKQLVALCAASETAAELDAMNACADLGWESRTKTFAQLPPLPRLVRSKKENDRGKPTK